MGRDGETLAAIAAALSVTVWGYVAVLGPGRPLGLSATPVWLIVVGSLLAGCGGARMGVDQPTGQRRISRLAAGILVIGCVAVLAGVAALVAHPTRMWTRLVVAPVIVAGIVVGIVLARRLPSVSVAALTLVTVVAALWLVADLNIWTPHARFYDFNVYRAAGLHARLGEPVYLQAAATRLPAGAADDFFLYPPPLIPLLALVSRLPAGATAVAFAAAMAVCGILAYRALGMSWRWAVLLLSFPPMVKGIESGNVANLMFLLFAAGVAWGPGLVLGVLFKVQYVVPAAWLVRERRWRDIAIGMAIVLAVCLVTLPFVGVNSWTAWLAGLGYRQQTQVNVPILYGNSLARYLPTAVFVLVALAATAAALTLRGRRGLAGLGLASIVASPSLWLHGFVVAIPAVLGLRSATAIWLVLGIGGLGGGSGPAANLALWSMVVVGAVALVHGRWSDPVAPGAAGNDVGVAVLDPLAGQPGPWSTAQPGLPVGDS